jgi:hypothetical protein
MDQVEEKPKFSWLNTIRQAQLTGLRAMLATHCEPKSFDALTMSLELEVHASMKKYIDSGMGDDLQKSLRDVLGSRLSIKWQEGPALNSPAVKARTRRSERVIEVLREIEGDRFFKTVSQAMGGKVILESIKFEEKTSP